MRIYLAPCGMGVGHISRCKTITNLLTEHGWSIFVSTYSDGLEYAKGLGYQLVETVPLTMKTNSDGGIDFKLTAATSPGLFRGLWSILRQIIAEIRNIQRIKPALVVSDSRASSLIAARLLGVPSTGHTQPVQHQAGAKTQQGAHRSTRQNLLLYREHYLVPCQPNNRRVLVICRQDSHPRSPSSVHNILRESCDSKIMYSQSGIHRSTLETDPRQPIKTRRQKPPRI